MSAAGAPQVLVVGPHGVTGSAITARLGASTSWDLLTASRRKTSPGYEARHVSVDLLDPRAARAAFADLGEVTHLVYAAYLVP
jgi:nucleoside-diphosphate-sugar epimerase